MFAWCSPASQYGDEEGVIGHAFLLSPAVCSGSFHVDKSGRETTSHMRAPAPAIMKIEANSAEFKSVAQRLTGKDAVAGGRWSGGPGKEEEEAQGFVMYCSSPFADRNSKSI
ncbi:hypothetical protein ABZP36_014550 [Zizania latifolia]